MRGRNETSNGPTSASASASLTKMHNGSTIARELLSGGCALAALSRDLHRARALVKA